MGQDEVLDTNVLMYSTSGTTTIFNIIEYPKAAEKQFSILWPTKQDYQKAFEVMVDLVGIGKPIPAIDILIASICINRNLVLKTKDKHLEFVQKVEPSFRVALA